MNSVNGFRFSGSNFTKNISNLVQTQFHDFIFYENTKIWSNFGVQINSVNYICNFLIITKVGNILDVIIL